MKAREQAGTPSGASGPVPAPSGPGLDASVEQLAAKRGTNCETGNRPYLVGTGNGKNVVVWRPDCHMWSCPHCGRQKANHLVHVIAYGVHVYVEAEPYRRWSFVTLTARGDRRGQTESLEDFRRGWPKLRKRIARAYPYRLHFAAVPECHHDEGKTVHMHMLLNVLFGDAKQYTKRDGCTVWRSRWLARAATACGLGWSHDCTPLESETQAAVYIAKYATNQAGDADFPRAMQHYRTSTHWPRHDDGKPADSNLKWMTVMPDNLYAVLDNFRRAGYTISGGGERT